jgi:hypothetical protein
MTEQFTKDEIGKLRRAARKYLKDPRLDKLEKDVKENILLILMMDGKVGTEPWRNNGAGGNSAAVGSAARQRYVTLGSALLEDIEAGKGDDTPMLEGIVE